MSNFSEEQRAGRTPLEVAREEVGDVLGLDVDAMLGLAGDEEDEDEDEGGRSDAGSDDEEGSDDEDEGPAKARITPRPGTTHPGPVPFTHRCLCLPSARPPASPPVQPACKLAPCSVNE